MNFFQLLLRLSSVSALTSAIVLITSMVLGRIMVPADFGQYSFLQSVLMMLVNVSSLAASLSISVFMYRAPKNKLSRIFNNTFFTVLPVFFFTGLVIIFSWNLYKGFFDSSLILILVNATLMSVCLIGIDYLRMKQNIRIYSFLFMGYTSSIAVFSVIGYLIGEDVFYLYLSSAFALLFPSCYTLFIISKSFKISFNFERKLKTYLWSLKYGVPVVSSTVVMSFLVIGDKIILGSVVSKSELAQYSIATLIASTSLFLVNNFASAWGAFLFRKLPTLDRYSVRVYYFKTMKWILLGMPSLLFMYGAQILLYVLFFSEKYPGLSSSIFMLTSSYCLLGVSKYFMGYLNYFNRNVLIFYSAFLSCIIMFISSVYIIGMTVFGMAMSVFISMFCLSFFIAIFATKEVNKYALK